MPCRQKVAAGPFRPCFAYPNVGDACRARVASKNRAVLESQIRPQFSEFSLAIESAVFHKCQNTADSRTRLNFEIVAVSAIPTPP